MSNHVVKKIDKFETHHQVLFFSIILVVTVVLVRALVQIYNPNPILFGLEIHHFDYGILLLLIVVILLLFGSKKYYNLYLAIAAVSTGLVLDDYLYIKQSLVENPTTQTQIYNSSILHAAILVVVSILIVFFIGSLWKVKAAKKRRVTIHNES